MFESTQERAKATICRNADYGRYLKGEGIHKMRILITGGSGFIGKNMLEFLENKNVYEVYAPTSSELNCLNENDVRKYLEHQYFDYVLHFAAYGDSIDKNKDGTKILEYNLRMFLNFAKCACLYGKMYYTGSGAEYDKRYDISMVKEDEIGKTIPIDQYGLMKYIIGQFIETSRNIYNFRLFGIFGKYEYYPTKFISNVCCKAIKGLPLVVRQNVYFDYLWVEDFVKIIEYYFYHTPKFHTYNIVSGKKISLKEICEVVLKISKKQLPIYVCKSGIANEYTASNERFLKECSGFTYSQMEEAVSSLYEWYEQHIDKIDLLHLLYQ